MRLPVENFIGHVPQSVGHFLILLCFDFGVIVTIQLAQIRGDVAEIHRGHAFGHPVRLEVHRACTMETCGMFFSPDAAGVLEQLRGQPRMANKAMKKIASAIMTSMSEKASCRSNGSGCLAGHARPGFMASYRSA